MERSLVRVASQQVAVALVVNAFF